MAVEIFELGEIEAGRRLADSIQAEPLDHLFGREDLVVAMAPAEAREIVAHRLGQIAHGPIGLDAERAMALRQLGAVRPMDQRNMRHHRHTPAHAPGRFAICRAALVR